MSHSPNRVLGIVFGLIYMLAGILGFFITSATPFFSTQGSVVIGLFETNPLHALIHLIIGIALLVCGLWGPRAAQSINLVIGAVLIVLGIVGIPLSIGDNPINVFATNGWDVALHLVTGAVLLGLGLAAAREARAARLAKTA